MAASTSGRILLGGRREGFQGEMPGLLEEAVFAVENGQPLYLAGGFGGITFDIAVALGVYDGKWLPPVTNSSDTDERIRRGLARLTEAAKTSGGKSLANGLTQEDNLCLAPARSPR
jgi:hypothetical protein